MPTSLSSPACAEGDRLTNWTMLGSMLFSRGVSGCRVVARGQGQTVASLQFQNYGAHHNDYPHSYLTVAAAVGTQPAEIDAFLGKLAAALSDLSKHRQKAQARQQLTTDPPSKS